MNWEHWRDENRQGWESRVPVHVGPKGYDRQSFIEDPEHVSGVIAFDRPRLNGGRGLAGLDVVHLQCHIGTDTLSLLRCGAATVTGLDFSPLALVEARWLFDATGADGRFVESDVYDAVAALGVTYDLVYASVGAINWVPDIRRWLAVASALLKPGGALYVRDTHPFYMSLDPDNQDDLSLRVKYDYFESAEPVSLDDDQTYTGDGTPIAFTMAHEWSHGIADILQGALAAGLVIENFWEDEFSDWQALPQMIEGHDGRFRMPDGYPRMPFYFALSACKPVIKWPPDASAYLSGTP